MKMMLSVVVFCTASATFGICEHHNWFNIAINVLAVALALFNILATYRHERKR